MIERDTSAAAHAVQVAIWRRMTGAQRVQMTVSMSDEARDIALSGIRARHPEYDATQARQALFRLVLGDAVFQAAYPNWPSLDP